MAYLEPEILQLPEETLWSYVDSLPELGVYRHYLEDLVRNKPHVLSTREEQILAQVSEFARGPGIIFDMLNEADLKFGVIRDEDGEEVELTHGRYSQFIRSKDRRVRKDAFQGLHAQYIAHKNTLAATYNTSVQTNVFYARMRNHGSALEAALHPDNVPVSVYDNLIQAVRDSLPALHRYLRLRKRLLNLDDLHMYDLYVPLVPDVDYKIPYEEGKRIVKAGVVPLGEEYQKAVDICFNERWVDVYETQNKMSGAYVRTVYSAHPYMLLNYQETLMDVFTIAHELGHAMHSHFTLANQPYVYSDYSIFVAEVASTVNEALLVNYLLDSETDHRRRAYIVNYYLEQFRTTMFRQTMFAEFEKLAHEQVESGGAADGGFPVRDVPSAQRGLLRRRGPRRLGDRHRMGADSPLLLGVLRVQVRHGLFGRQRFGGGHLVRQARRRRAVSGIFERRQLGLSPQRAGQGRRGHGFAGAGPAGSRGL